MPRTPVGPWVPKTVTLQQQRDALSLIHRITLHYVSALKSVKYNRLRTGASFVTMGLLLAAFDTVVRLHASDEVSPVSKTLCAKVQEDLDSKVIEGSKALAEERRKERAEALEARGTTLEAQEAREAAAKKAAAETATAMPSAPPTYGTVVTSFGGETLVAILEKCLLDTPHVAVARAALVRHNQHMAQIGQPLFVMSAQRVSMFGPPMFTMDKDSPTQTFMKQLLKVGVWTVQGGKSPPFAPQSDG